MITTTKYILILFRGYKKNIKKEHIIFKTQLMTFNIYIYIYIFFYKL